MIKKKKNRAKSLEATDSPSGEGRFRAVSVLRIPGVAGVVLASFAARLPLSMMGLATIFFVQEETGSTAVAGVAVAAFSLTSGLGAPLRGRLVDRRGIDGGLLPLALAHAAATAALLVAAQLPAANVFLVLAAGLGGATAPPVNAAMRALWPTLVAPEDLDAAYGTEAVVQEIAYVAGPFLAGLLVFAVSVEAPIVVSAVLVVAGALLFARHPAAGGLRKVSAAARTPLASPGMKALVATLALGAVALGVLEVVVPIFGEEHGSAASAGLLVSAISLASLAGGVWYGMRRWTVSAVTRLIGASAVATAGYVVAVLAGSIPLLALGILVFGLTLAPTLAAVYAILDDVAPEGSAVESLTWITTATAAGAALGAALAGIAINRVSIQFALAIGALAMLLATAVPLLVRRHLEGEVGGALEAAGSGSDGRREQAAD